MPPQKNIRTKPVNIALQGGGAHGAFAWGVLDALAADGRLEFEGLSGTSSGSINAAVFADGWNRAGPDGAREALETFWRRLSRMGELFSPIRRSLWERMLRPRSVNIDAHPGFVIFNAMTRMVSPYEMNPLDLNPLRDLVADSVDFDVLRGHPFMKLFISATNVRTGKVRVFMNHELSLDVIMASCCLPFLFRAVEIDGEAYWDGGYMGNPSLFPFWYHTKADDIAVVHITPLERDEIPKTAPEIMNRIHEISFNSSLLREFRAVHFVKKLIKEDWLREERKHELRNIRIHSIRSEKALTEFSVSSKLNTEWPYLLHLRDLGRETAEHWMEETFPAIGSHSTVDLEREFLALGSHHIG